MGVLFSGIVHASGGRDAGKTTLIVECGAEPQDICFIDSDVKGKATVDSLLDKGLKFGMYVDLTKETAKMKETEYHYHVADLIYTRIQEHIQKERKGKPFECIGFDNFAMYENSFFPVVNKKPLDYRETYSAKGDIKGAQIWQASFDYETRVLSDLLGMTKMLILTSHLKNETVGAIKTGRFIPDCKKPVLEKAVFRVFMYPSGTYAAPVGLILKRPSRVEVDPNGGIKVINVLPRKMNPFTWERVRWFFDHPVGDKAFLEDELPDEYDQSLLSNQLTPDQHQIFDAHIELAKRGILNVEEEEVALDPEFIRKSREMQEAGYSLPEISKELGKTIPEVAKALAQA